MKRGDLESVRKSGAAPTRRIARRTPDAGGGIRSGTALLLPLAMAASLCLGCGRGGSASDVSSLDRYRQSGRRIEAAVNSIERALAATPGALVTSALSAAPASAPARRPDEEEQVLSFQLKGIVGTERAPMVLTSAGLAGLGEHVQGFKVVKIEDDAVTFADKRGRQVKVNLYKDEPGP